MINFPREQASHEILLVWRSCGPSKYVYVIFQ